MKHTPIAIALVCSLLLTGCGSGSGIWTNYREIELLQPVQTLGIDSASTGVRLSVSCARPGSDSKVSILSRPGMDLSSAMASLQDYAAGGQLYYSHARHIILGEDYAKAGIGAALDFIERDNALRMGMSLFVARDTSAQGLITGPADAGYDITETLGSVKRDAEALGEGRAFTCRETIKHLSECGAVLVCAVKSGEIKGSVFMDKEEGDTAMADGYAIIKDQRLVDYIDSSLSPTASLLLGYVGSAGPILRVPDGEVRLLTEQGSVKVTPRWNSDGSLDCIEIHAKLRCAIAEVRSEIDNITDAALLENLGKALSQRTKEDIRAVLDLSQKHGADFLGMVKHLRSDSAAKAAALPEDWLETARFEVSVDAQVVHTQDMGDQMSTKGGGS